ncbi:MAG TPA: N-acetylmuramoyl-L-alanine amidase [Xanthobacteraceae bacterium]|nr:N-acetylmuramoyl-L-alanine amidase [Xanthobacteraceae bacterium]
MSIRAKSLILTLAGAAMLAGLLPASPTGWFARAAAAGFPVATDSRIGGDENQTRFVVDLSAKVGLRAFTLADPYRVVVDLPQVTFQLKPKAGESGRGLIKAFRFGLVMQGGSRIVLDLTKPVRIDKAFTLDAAEGQPARLVIDLTAVDRETFLRTIAQENRAPPQAQQRKNGQDAGKNAGDPRPLIVLDPGHGGIDNGTHAPSGENEKTLVLDFALSLRDKIEKLGKYRVVMTRTDDVFVPLAERVRLARQRQASLFISIHADALGRGDGDAQGATVYTLSETASDAEADRLAEAENKADVIAGVDLSSEPGDVADILIDLAQRETKTFSGHFARTLVSEIKTVARMHKNPLKSAGFRVLRAADVPSVLLELGFVSNRQDLKQLTSEAWRSRTADAVVAAVDAYFSTRVAGTAAAPAGP